MPEAKVKAPKDCFLHALKVGGTVQLNLCLLLHDIFRLLVLYRRMTQQLWKILHNLHFNCMASTRTIYFFQPCYVLKTISFSVFQYQSSHLYCRMHLYEDFPQAVNKHSKVKNCLIEMLLTMLLTSMTLGEHRSMKMEKFVKQSA